MTDTAITTITIMITTMITSAAVTDLAPPYLLNRGITFSPISRIVFIVCS